MCISTHFYSEADPQDIWRMSWRTKKYSNKFNDELAIELAFLQDDKDDSYKLCRNFY